MDPLFLVVWPDYRHSGSYGSSVITVRSLEQLRTLAHEYCHAHQDWVVDPDRPGIGIWWERTAEGKAFIAAWDADRPTDDPLLLSSEERYGSLEGDYPRGEHAATICSPYFVETERGTLGTVGRRYIRDRLPHLYAWAEEWLRHR